MDKNNSASVSSTGSPLVPPESSNSQTNVSPSESKPPKPPNKRKSESSGGRAPSSVWDHFDKVMGEDGKRRAVCKYCFKEYMADSRTHGTSNLRSHTPNCKQFPNNDKDGQQTLSFKSKQNAEEFEKAFNRLKYEDPNFETYFKDVDGGIRRIPNEEDWKKCRLFVRFLKLFYLATKKFSGSLFVTSNAFYKEMYKIESTINQLILDNDDVLCTMAMSMKQKFNKYWGDGNKINLLLYVAVALDPTKKIAYLEFCFANIFHGEKRKVDEMVNKIISCLTRLYNHYATIYSSNESVSRVTEVETMLIDEDDLDSQMESQFNSYMEGRFTSGSKSELDKYLGEVEHFAKNQTFEILEYWKNNATKYRVLSQIAKDVLAMPISTVASESAFSTGGRILDPFIFINTTRVLWSNVPLQPQSLM